MIEAARAVLVHRLFRHCTCTCRCDSCISHRSEMTIIYNVSYSAGWMADIYIFEKFGHVNAPFSGFGGGGLCFYRVRLR
jgi:hypothetical protein